MCVMSKMMCIGCLLVCIRCFGQGPEVQQLILNIEKLAQMKATYQAMVNGYRTMENGYRNVSNLTKGNFDLHKDYLDGLLAVNPVVRQNGKVNGVLRNQVLLVEEYKSAYRQMQVSGMLRADELVTLKNSLVLLVNSSVSSVDELIDVLTPGKMRMNDEERISVINRIDTEVSSLLEKLRTVAGEYKRLADARAKRKKETNALKALYGIKQ